MHTGVPLWRHNRGKGRGNSMNKATTNLVITAIAGQGITLMTRVLSEALAAEGVKVVSTDFPPPGQRLTAGWSNIRWGEKVYAEQICDGDADFLVGLDRIEAFRVAIRYAADDCLVLMNESIVPRPLAPPKLESTFGWHHPTLDDILSCFKRCGINNVKHFDATKLAREETGTHLTVNAVMLGAGCASGMFPVKEKTMENAIAGSVPPKMLELNLKAFRTGVEKFKAL